MSLPPDLSVLCRRLTTAKVDDLPGLCPLLVNHVLRSAAPLSAPHEAKSKDQSTETSKLLHKLKTQINSLFGGKTPPAGRFAAAVLVKSIVDVGGWECLRVSDPWVRGLLAALQKPDPFASKELYLVALVRIYTLLASYPTLVSEIAKPTLPAFVKACIQLVKPTPADKASKVPASFTEMVASALLTIVPLYETTMRPFAAQIRSVFRAFIAPTASDSLLVPHSLKAVARRLVISLHHTAPKSGNGEEWTTTMRASIKDAHATASLVFRAVQEYWEPASGYIPPSVSPEDDLQGGGDSSEELPSWSGLQSGADRLIGLLEFLADHFRSSTKGPADVPVGDLLDLALRVTLVKAPSSSSKGRQDEVQLNAAVGREEKAELWSVLPDIHKAALQLNLAIVRRFRQGALPFASDVLDQTVRTFNASRHAEGVPETAYALTRDILLLAGPTLPKMTLDTLNPILQSCCRDLLQAAGHGPENKDPEAAHVVPTKAKQKEGSNNADDFLNTKVARNLTVRKLSPTHHAAAQALLETLLTHAPQQHLSPEARSVVDRTAILTGDKAAMLASCLHPYKDKNGRFYPSILPFLVQQFPRDQEVDVLRANLQGASRGPQASWDAEAALIEAPEEDEASEAASEAGENDQDAEAAETVPKAPVGFAIAEHKMEVDTVNVADNAFNVQPGEEGKEIGEQTLSVSLKRKGSEVDLASPKKLSTRRETRSSAVSQPVLPAAVVRPVEEDSEDDSDGGSIQIDATLSDDDEAEDDE